MNTTLQVPMNKELRERATAVSERLGFSSLQEAVRVFLGKLSSGNIDIEFVEKPVKLSPKAARRYDKILAEIKKGKGVYRAQNVDDLFRQLNS